MCSGHLLTIINDLLDLSKIEAGRMALEARLFELEECIRQGFLLSEGLSKKWGRAKSVELSWQLEENVPKRIVGDPTRLRQILVNLIHNAIKFTSKGHVRLRVRKAEEEEVQRRLPKASIPQQPRKTPQQPSGADNHEDPLSLEEDHGESLETVHLKFSVEDTGVGIPRSHLERIFDAFTQVSSSFKKGCFTYVLEACCLNKTQLSFHSGERP